MLGEARPVSWVSEDAGTLRAMVVGALPCVARPPPSQEVGLEEIPVQRHCEPSQYPHTSCFCRGRI